MESLSAYLERTADRVDSDPYAGTDYAGRAYCAQCGRFNRITERAAFRGADQTRAALACGHIVARPTTT